MFCYFSILSRLMWLEPFRHAYEWYLCTIGEYRVYCWPADVNFYWSIELVGPEYSRLTTVLHQIPNFSSRLRIFNVFLSIQVPVFLYTMLCYIKQLKTHQLYYMTKGSIIHFAHILGRDHHGCYGFTILMFKGVGWNRGDKMANYRSIISIKILFLFLSIFRHQVSSWYYQTKLG